MRILVDLRQFSWKLSTYAISIILSIIGGILIASLKIENPFTLSELLIIGLLLLTIVAPFILAIRGNQFDIFEPVFMQSFITFVFFFLIPTSLAYKQDGYVFYGVDYRRMLSVSISVSLIALLGFYAGYYLGKRYLKPKARWILAVDTNRVVNNLVIYSVIITFLLVTWIIASGFPIWSLNIFDERSDYGTWFNLSQSNIGYLYSARLAYIPILLLLLAYRRHQYPRFLWVMSYIVVTIIYLVMGVRIAPITLLLATLIYVYLQKSIRPKTHSIAFMALFIFVLNGFMGIARSPNQDTVITLAENWRTFLEGNSIIYGMSMVMLVFPRFIPFQNGKIFLSDLLLPVPRIIWPGKPANVLIESIHSFIPVHYSPPIFGSWYADFGWIGPVILMFLLGYGCAYVYIVWKNNPKNPATRVFLAISLASLLMIYTRVNAVVFNWIFWVIGPIFFIHIISKKIVWVGNNNDRKL